MHLLIRTLQSELAHGPIAQSRLERTPDKREVVGSTPTRPMNLGLLGLAYGIPAKASAEPLFIAV